MIALLTLHVDRCPHATIEIDPAYVKAQDIVPLPSGPFPGPTLGLDRGAGLVMITGFRIEGNS